MTTVRRWLARALQGQETFPEEFRAERLDQPYPLTRPAWWYGTRQAGQVRLWLR